MYRKDPARELSIARRIRCNYRRNHHAVRYFVYLFLATRTFFFACKRRPFHLFVIQRTHQSLASYTSSEFSPIAAVPFFFVAKKKPGQNKIRYFSSLQLAAAVAAVTQAQAHPRRNTRIQTQRNEDYRDELAGEWRDLNLGNQFRRDFLPPAPARMCNNENNS